jgi:hypothetical protein
LRTLAKHPHLRVAKIADAGSDNWEFTATLPEGPEILDFFHATEHLAAAIAAVHGDGTFATRHKFEELRERLLTEDDGVNRVIGALVHLRNKHPRIRKVASLRITTCPISIGAVLAWTSDLNSCTYPVYPGDTIDVYVWSRP